MHIDHAPDIENFLKADSFAVVGASTNRQKYGNRVFRVLLDDGRKVVPINPHAATVAGHPAFPRLSALAEAPEAICVITQPEVTEQIVEEAIRLGIRHIWMQPGAESDRAIAACQSNGINLIHSGPCILVVVGLSGR